LKLLFNLFFCLFQLGSTAIGISTPEGVVLAVEKRVTSTLIIPSSIEKIVEIDTHIGWFYFYVFV
jgi:20S proteasome alpha/beta subunit